MTANDAVAVLLPVDPPELSCGAARILVEILLDAVEYREDMAASTNRITPRPLDQEVAER
jgi:hypothetical protein